MPANRDRKHGSKQVQNLNHSLNKPLNSTMLQVLLAIAQGYHTNKEITQHLGISKSLTAYHLKRLQERGLIKRTVKDVIVIYELTESGKSYCSNLVTLPSKDSPRQIRAHDLFFVVDILRKPRSFEKRLKQHNWIAFYPANYRAWKKKIAKANLIFKPNVLEIYLADIYAPTPQNATAEAIKTVLEIIEQLEQDYPGLRLGKPQEVARLEKQHIAIQHDPLAVLYAQEGKSYRSERIHIDHSHGVPELETVHKTLAGEDIHKITRFYEELVRERDFSIRDLKELQLMAIQSQMELKKSLETLIMVMGEGVQVRAPKPLTSEKYDHREVV